MTGQVPNSELLCIIKQYTESTSSIEILNVAGVGYFLNNIVNVASVIQSLNIFCEGNIRPYRVKGVDSLIQFHNIYGANQSLIFLS
jgi:hypothetical protein